MHNGMTEPPSMCRWEPEKIEGPFDDSRMLRAVQRAAEARAANETFGCVENGKEKAEEEMTVGWDIWTGPGSGKIEGSLEVRT